MEENHLLPLYSSTEANDSESDCSISSDDEVIQNVIQMLDEVMDISNITKELQDNEEEDDDDDDEQQPVQIDIPTSSIHDTTADPTRSPKSYHNNDKFTEDTSSKRRSWTVKEKLNVIKAFKKCKNISLVSRQHYCDRKQLREWLKEEQQPLPLIKDQNNGKKLIS